LIDALLGRLGETCNSWYVRGARPGRDGRALLHTPKGWQHKSLLL